MNRKYISTSLALLLGTALSAVPVSAAQHEKEGQGMGKEDRATMQEQREQQRMMREEQQGEAVQLRDEQREQMRERMEEQEGMEGQGMEGKGMEKQREMKSIQEQKELGKGSETGQEAREQRKKWWRFWD
jgi:hypothetical protein